MLPYGPESHAGNFDFLIIFRRVDELVQVMEVKLVFRVCRKLHFIKKATIDSQVFLQVAVQYANVLRSAI